MISAASTPSTNIITMASLQYDRLPYSPCAGFVILPLQGASTPKLLLPSCVIL